MSPLSETSESLAVTAARLADALEQDVRDFLVVRHQTPGDIEVQIEQQSRELLRVAAEKAAQKKAEVTPPVCPVCQQRLSRVTGEHRRSFECRFGTITLGRSRGYCKRCGKASRKNKLSNYGAGILAAGKARARSISAWVCDERATPPAAKRTSQSCSTYFFAMPKWRFPADAVLGLEETAGYSPRVQEMAALLASKMPVGEARTGWITAPGSGGASRLAAAPSSQPVGKPNAGSSGPANTGASGETNHCCAWKLSGAMGAGISSSQTTGNLTCLKTEMRTQGSGASQFLYYRRDGVRPSPVAALPDDPAVLDLPGARGVWTLLRPGTGALRTGPAKNWDAPPRFLGSEPALPMRTGRFIVRSLLEAT